MPIDARTEPRRRLRHVITIDAHTLVADMPVLSGGDDGGPSSHDYFDASLVACMGQTAILYARLHELPLERVLLHVERDASREREGTYVLSVTVGLEGDLTLAQRARVLEIVDRCPIHKLMTTATVEIRTVEGGPFHAPPGTTGRAD